MTRRWISCSPSLRAACCGDDPLKDCQPGTHQPVAAQSVHGAAQQRQRPIMAKRAVGQPRPQRVQIGVSARSERADLHGLRNVLGAGFALGVQTGGLDRRQHDVELACDQRRSGHGQLLKRGWHEPEPAQGADGDGDREAAVDIAVACDELELVVGEREERGQRRLVDLLWEALPLRALTGGQDLDGHQKSTSKSLTAFWRSDLDGRL